MRWVKALSDPQGLRRCMCDLVALSTPPATWKSCDPRHGAEGLDFARARNGGVDGR